MGKSFEKKQVVKPKEANNSFFSSSFQNPDLLFRIILLAVPLLLYWQTFSFNLSYNDDCIILIDQAAPLLNFDLHKIFFSDAWLLNKSIELYRPLQSLTYAIDFLFSKTNPGVFHIHNVLIFCICVQLLFSFLLRLKIIINHAFWISLLFSVHFLLAHTVSWIPARGDLYLFVFSVGCLLSWSNYFYSNKILHLIIASLLYFLALLSKESATVLIPINGLAGFLFWNFKLNKLKSFLIFTPSIILTIVYLWMRSQCVDTSSSLFNFHYLVYNLPLIPEEVFKFFVPMFFCVMPFFNPLITYSGIAVIAVIGVSVFLFRKKINNKLVLFGMVCFLVPLIPVLFYKTTFSDYSYQYLDHRMIFPGVGLLLIIYSLVEKLFYKKQASIFLTVLVVAMSYITYGNAGYYKNFRTYFENAIAYHPQNGYAWLQYGVVLSMVNEEKEAIEKFKHIKQIQSNNSDVRDRLATAYYNEADYPNMIRECKEFILIDSSNSKPYYLLALYFNNTNQNDSALKYISIAKRKMSYNPNAFYYSGEINNKLGNLENAIADFTKAVSLKSDFANAYFERGTTYGRLKKMNEALTDFNRYIQLNPNDSKGYYFRGQLYFYFEDKVKGCNDLHKASDLGSKKADLLIKQFCL